MAWHHHVFSSSTLEEGDFDFLAPPAVVSPAVAAPPRCWEYPFDCMLRLLCIALASAPPETVPSIVRDAPYLLDCVQQVARAGVCDAAAFEPPSASAVRPLTAFGRSPSQSGLFGLCVSDMLALPSPRVIPHRSSAGIVSLWFLQVLAAHAPRRNVFVGNKDLLLAVTKLASNVGQMQDVATKALYACAEYTRTAEAPAHATCLDAYECIRESLFPVAGFPVCSPENAMFIVRTVKSLMENPMWLAHATWAHKVDCVSFLTSILQLEDDAVLHVCLSVIRSVVTSMPETRRACRLPGAAGRIAGIIQQPDARLAKLAIDVLNACVSGSDCSTSGAMIIAEPVLRAVSACVQHPTNSVSLLVTRLEGLLTNLFSQTHQGVIVAHRTGAVALPPAFAPALIAMLQPGVSHALQNAAVSLVFYFAAEPSLQDLQATLPACLAATARATADDTCNKMFLASIFRILINPAAQPIADDTLAEVVAVIKAAFITCKRLVVGSNLHRHDVMRAFAAKCILWLLEKNPALAASYRADTRFMTALHFVTHPAHGCVPEPYKVYTETLLRTLESVQEKAAGHAVIEGLIMDLLVPFTPQGAAAAGGEGTGCAVCLEPLTEQLVYTPCFHLFHATCLRDAVKHCKRCPICKSDVLAKIISM